MIAATLVVTLLFSIFALRAKPGTAMGLIIACMMIWPEYLRIPMGLAQMSAPRLMALVLLVRLLMLGRGMSLKKSSVDVLVIVGWLWTIFATVVVSPDSAQVTTMIGRGFDTVLMYFVARLALMTIDDVKNILIPIAITALYMCAMGVLEAMMLYSPYSSFQAHRGWTWIAKEAELRLGFLRAVVSTSVSIYFGMAMMLITGMLWSMRGYGKPLIVNPGSIIAAFIGALTSLSSGPWSACALLIIFSAFVKRTALIKPMLIFVSITIIFVEIASNRHFYHLIGYLALDGSTAWYRARLLEVAFSQWREFWLLGVGDNWPHHWGAILDGRKHIDVVNHFIILALYGGFPGMIMYIASHVIAVRAAVRAWRLHRDDQIRQMIFGFAATLVALDLASYSVGLFGPVLLLSYILLGFIVSVSGGWYQKRARVKISA